MFDGRHILITGGTGSFGNAFVEIMLNRYRPERLIIFSRDELKQSLMQKKFSELEYPCLRYFIGDVRDRNRLYRALTGVEFVVHAAALKQIPSCEYNPLEAINTNVLGAANLIDAAIDRNVQRVIALSTDKAANPINLYGATKLCADKLFSAANSYAGAGPTCFSVVRYGNVLGSRGSVVPLFLRERANGVLPITDPRMTRFWITLSQGVEFVLKCFERMSGGEIFVPKIPSMNIMDLARAIAPECQTEIVGIRPGEKLHEVMVSEDAALNTVEYDDYFTILPSLEQWLAQGNVDGHGKRCPEGFSYSSDNNTVWLSQEELREWVRSHVDQSADA